MAMISLNQILHTLNHHAVPLSKCKWDFQYSDLGEELGAWWSAYYSPQGPETSEVYQWCRGTFGPSGIEFGNDTRWSNSGGWVRFRNEEDMIWFVMKWKGQ